MTRGHALYQGQVCKYNEALGRAVFSQIQERRRSDAKYSSLYLSTAVHVDWTLSVAVDPPHTHGLSKVGLRRIAAQFNSAEPNHDMVPLIQSTGET